MFLTTKLNLLSCMFMGASAVLLMTQMRKRCRKHKHKSSTTASTEKTVSQPNHGYSPIEEIGHACFAQIASTFRHLFVKDTAHGTFLTARF